MVQPSLARKATLFVLLSIAIVAGTIWAVTTLYALPQIHQYERGEILRATEHLHRIVQHQGEEFSRSGEDWATRDGLVEFTTQNLPGFAESHLTYRALSRLKWNVAAIVTKDSKLRWGGQLNQPTQTIDTLPPAFAAFATSGRLLPEDKADAPQSGLVIIDDTPWLVAAIPIRGGHPIHGTTVGHLVYGQLVDAHWQERLQRLTLTSATLQPLTSPPKDAVESDARRQLLANSTEPTSVLLTDRELRGYRLSADLFGSPAFVLELIDHRRLARSGFLVMNATFFALCVSSLLVMLLAFLWVGTSIITPITTLRDAVRTLERGKHSAVILDRQDELGELASGFNRMARTIRERETTLRQAHTELKLILDSTADTLCGCTLTGAFRGKPSAMGPKWFGEPDPEHDVAAWLFGNELTLTNIFRLGLAQLAEDRLPISVALAQLPQRFTRSERNYDIVYRPIREGDDIIGLLLVVKDVTSKLQAERSERESRELQIVIGNLVRDHVAFEHFVAECETLLQALHTETDLTRRLIHLHTLKGACSIFGLLSFSAACQDLESKVMVNAEAMNHEALSALRKSLRSTLNRVRRFAPNLDEKRLSISLDDYSKFVELVEQRLGHERLLAEAMRLPLEPGERLLAPLVQHAQRIAAEQGKTVEIEIDDGGLRLVEDSTRLFWSTLVHGIRNAIEHGIETSEERLLAGKSPQGTVRFVMRDQGAHLAVSIIDDGRGIDWAALAKRAYQNRLPSNRDDLVALLFTDGLSTKDETSSSSGRGIGLSALRATCHALGGTCIVHAGPNGRGTELLCTISMTIATQTPTSLQHADSHSRLSLRPEAPEPATQLHNSELNSRSR